MSAIYPNDYYLQGLHHYLVGNWDPALDCFRKSLNSDPFNYLVLSFAANCEWKMSLYPELLKTVEIIKTKFPENQINPDIIRSLDVFLIHRSDENQDQYNEDYQQGLNHYLSGNWNSALDCFRKSLSYDPFNYLILSFTADCEWKMSMYPDLMNTIATIQEKYPKNQINPDIIKALDVFLIHNEIEFEKKHDKASLEVFAALDDYYYSLYADQNFYSADFSDGWNEDEEDQEEYSYYDLQQPEFYEEWEEQDKYT